MKNFCFMFSLFLSGCFYHDGCIYTPQMVNCSYDSDYPDITRYQKIDKIGRTSPKQRWLDAINCGAQYNEDGWIHETLPKLDKSSFYNINGKRRFVLCMKEKNYIYFDAYDCWKKKICN
ncbi:hypothetical protein B0186_11250 [Canicola haemoglobinophilus]|uniref:Lipoprotein n=1 Tax=Canicola haemoglobinophilus TaxID=733 RepID=A0A1V4AYB2_9PAST|nr:hypothetical protein [Canicola haemoglobinophilus]OOR95668.1 hypothetical protein B0186_11250 [Canicola haemoglobinophilus]STO59570.1 Uncharacterised protein [Canicola haemoglobinophilus]